jgi:hypothetical protein
MPSPKSILWTAAIAAGVYLGIEHFKSVKGK